MIWILLLILVLWEFCVFIYFKKDSFNPTVLYNMGFIVAIFVAALNTQKWGVKLSVKTLLVILIGSFAFFFGNLLGVKIREKKRRTEITGDRGELRAIVVENWKVWLLIVIGIVTIYRQSIEVRIIASHAAEYYKQQGLMTAYKAALSDGYNMSELLQQMIRIVSVSAQILTFVLIYNFYFGSKRERKQLKWIAVLLVIYIVQCIMQAGRGSLINYFIYLIFLFYFTNKIKLNGFRMNIFKKKFILTGLLTVAAFLIFFYKGMGLVGRTTSANFFDYISCYLGSSIEMLDLYLREPSSKTDVFMGETMPVLINFFKRLGVGSSETIKVVLEYRETETGLIIGNIYTALRRYYNDLKWLGVCIFPFLMSLFFSLYYKSINKFNDFSLVYIFKVVVYGSLIGTVVLQAMEDSFYLYKITPGYMIELVEIYVMLVFFVGKNFNVHKN